MLKKVLFGCTLMTATAWWPGVTEATEQVAAQPAAYQVVRCKITVDGDPSDWKTIPPVLVRGEEHLWFGQGMTRKQWRGNDDLSYSWRAAWWGDKLYFLVEVTDDKVLGPERPSSFLCDGLEIYLDYGNRGGRRVKVLDGRADWFAKFDPKELMGYEMHFLPSSPPRVYLDHRAKYATDSPHNAEFARRWQGEIAAKRTKTGYLLEIGFSVPELR